MDFRFDPLITILENFRASLELLYDIGYEERDSTYIEYAERKHPHTFPAESLFGSIYKETLLF